MALTVRVTATYSIGAGKTDEVAITASSNGGFVEVVEPAEAGGIWTINERGRTGRLLDSVRVASSVLLTIRQGRRRR